MFSAPTRAQKKDEIMDKLENYLNKLIAIDDELAELDSGCCMLPMYAFVELRRQQLLKRRTATAKDYYLTFAKQNPYDLWIVDSFEKNAPILSFNKDLEFTLTVKELCKLYELDCNEHSISEMEKRGFCCAYTHVDQLGNRTTTEMATPLGMIRLLTDEKTTSQIAKRAQLTYNQDGLLER